LPGNYAGDKIKNAVQGNVDSKGRQYDLMSALGQTIAGLKNVPINEQELAKQKIGTLSMQQRDITSMISMIAKDQSLSREQKMERIADHKRQLQQLSIEIKKTSEAWKREKARGN